MELVISVIVFCVFICVFTIEVVAPASKNHCDKRWMILASSISLVQSVFTIVSGVIFVELFKHASLFEFRASHILVQGLLGFVLTSFIAYWWHRAMHKFDLLWRLIDISKSV